MSVRKPAVAGMFYPAGPADLRRMVEYCFVGPGGPGAVPDVNSDGPRTITGLISPHAGLVYSGSVAACGYYRLAEDGLPETVVIIGPNHRAYFPAIALSDDDAWSTPLGEMSVDSAIARKIVDLLPQADIDSAAHADEHSLEVQIPFLQYLAQSAGVEISIVPVLIGAAAQATAADSAVEIARSLGDAIARALEGRDAVVIASTDFTHYESGSTAAAKDSRAISAILGMDEAGLLETVRSMDISMCGPLPSAAVIAASRALGALAARKLAYRNSGDTTGDCREVVGYASIEFHR